MPVIAIPPKLSTTDPTLTLRTTDLNSETAGMIDAIIAGSGKARPIARYVNTDDIPTPPAPAWYLPATNDIYIHIEQAKLGTVPEILWHLVYQSKDTDLARIVGLYCHEAGHAAISDHMTPVQVATPRHFSLLSLLEELRVENFAVQRVAAARRFLRASFGLILANLPTEFERKADVVRAWAMCRGRTLAGVAAPDETDAVDIAARTLLGDDVVDGLTDLLQEALTLRLDHHSAKVRMIELCDEWVELVGETAETTGCTHCVKSAEPGDASGDPAEATAAAKPDADESEADEPAEGDGTGGDPADDDDTDDGEGGGDAADDAVDDATGGWGTPGFDGDVDDGAGAEALSDEDAELMSMLARDLADLMQDEWTRDADATELSKSGEWAAKVFGNREHSARLMQSEPTGVMRQHVVQVAQELSRLSLPTITKTAKAAEVPPGRLRSREALRASAERAGGRMVTAKPWKGTVRRHTSARPLIIGVATDTSGSMRWAENGVAEFAYVYTNAGHRIGARTAAVTFGSRVHRICRPGEVMTHVETKTASDATEQFDFAVAALDGVLHLTAPAYAARILIVISDGAFVKSGESAKAAEWLRRMDKAGTHVLWIRDREASGYNSWLPKTAKKLKRVTVVAADVEYGRRRSPGRVFDLLNGVALDAIRANVI